MMETVATIAARAKAAEKYTAIYIVNPAIAGRMAKMGYGLLAMGAEHTLIEIGARTLLADVRKSVNGK
jgi:4-hydroxy-2-oxoheptanedioate aldolase